MTYVRSELYMIIKQAGDDLRWRISRDHCRDCLS